MADILDVPIPRHIVLDPGSHGGRRTSASARLNAQRSIRVPQSRSVPPGGGACMLCLSTGLYISGDNLEGLGSLR